MRTTLTLDDDVAKELREAARSSGATFRETVNETLRKGLRRGEKPRARLPPFRVKARSCGFRQGVDVLRLNQLYDELETEDFHRKLRQPATGPRKP